MLSRIDIIILMVLNCVMLLGVGQLLVISMTKKLRKGNSLYHKNKENK